MKPPLSATLPAGHSALPLNDNATSTSSGSGSGSGSSYYSEIDAQTAHTQNILAGVGVMRGEAEDPMRSSHGSVDTWNNQVLRPQPSAEVYFDQAVVGALH